MLDGSKWDGLSWGCRGARGARRRGLAVLVAVACSLPALLFAFAVPASAQAPGETEGSDAPVADPVVVSVPVAVAVTEGSDSDAVVTISVDEAFGEEVFFRVTYADVTATGAGEGGDYDDIAVQDVRFGASDTSVDIEVGIRLDELAEEDETFTVTIAPAAPINEMFCRTTGIGCTGLDRDLPAGFVLGNATTTVTISDNQSPVIAEIADVTVGVGEEVDITATATDADGDALTYTWTREESETTPALPDNTALDSERLTFTPNPGRYLYDDGDR